MLAEKRLGRYLIYAIGEIFLVVIGILIALSINNWNSERLDAKKERLFLLEIKENLNEDLQNLDAILEFNELKIKTIDTAFYFLSIMEENPMVGRDFSNLFAVITRYESFTPVSVAFDNIIASGKIDILSSDELRKQISRYYSKDDWGGVQAQLIVSTQNFVGEVAPKMMNKNMMRANTKLEFDVRSVEEITVYKDPDVLSGLFVLQNKSMQVKKILNQVKTETKCIIESIDAYLDKDH
ncbi:MAG: hypothetical protein HKP08_07110 [Flavobacteriaceae bacterium]|nr:hypothetical protein [Flavobacteriaceae bacterium]